MINLGPLNRYQEQKNLSNTAINHMIKSPRNIISAHHEIDKRAL